MAWQCRTRGQRVRTDIKEEAERLFKCASCKEKCEGLVRRRW